MCLIETITIQYYAIVTYIWQQPASTHQHSTSMQMFNLICMHDIDSWQLQVQFWCQFWLISGIVPKEPMESQFVHCHSASSWAYVSSPPGHSANYRNHIWQIYVSIGHFGVHQILGQCDLHFRKSIFKTFTFVSVILEVMFRWRPNFLYFFIYILYICHQKPLGPCPVFRIWKSHPFLMINVTHFSS